MPTFSFSFVAGSKSHFSEWVYISFVKFSTWAHLRWARFVDFLSFGNITDLVSGRQVNHWVIIFQSLSRKIG
jgi:hypothetical protein